VCPDIIYSSPTELRQWFAAYTWAHHERRVSEHLSARGIEYFLPTYRVVHRWKDRKVELQLPLFPSYVFLRLAMREHFRVVGVPGIARIVGTSRQPTPLPECEIESLKNTRDSGLRAQPYPYLEIGRKVRIKAGPFEGLQGILVRRKGKFRVVFSLQLIRSSFVLDVDGFDVELIKDQRVA
jgi:transcription antitermination factor NusG